MHSANVSSVSERLLALAHRCIGGALRFDYLSNGTGHRQSTALRALRPALPKKISSGAPDQDIVRRYLAEVATRKRLSSSEEYCLATAARAGDAVARRRLIEHQLGLVVIMARPYCDRGLALLDLIEEGNIGLMTAIEKFDPERGCRFSTYAKWWIRQSIEMALMTQANIVRIPVHVTRALKQRLKSLASAPADSSSSIAPSADSSSSIAPSADSALSGTEKFLLHEVRNHDEAQALVEGVAAPEHEQPEWYLHTVSRRKLLQAALQRLKDSERVVLQSRFGLTDDVDCTLRDVAQRLNLSSERVRQIQEEALCKLRQILEAECGVGREGLF